MKVLVAVSGGLDSICLLNNLARGSTEDGLLNNFFIQNEIDHIEVCYVDHGQRADTSADFDAIEQVVANLKNGGGCKVAIGKLHRVFIELPKDCSEAEARKARYVALNNILNGRKLDRIATAHHADDVIETAIINLRRGTGPRGLSSLSHHPEGLWRPFLYNFTNQEFIGKDDLLKYAEQTNLAWNEDSTNKNGRYLRNRIRQKLKSAPESLKADFLKLLAEAGSIKSELLDAEQEVIKEVELPGCGGYKRDFFMEADKDVAKHIVHSVVSNYAREVDRGHIQEALDFIVSKNKGNEIHLRGCKLKIVNKDIFEVQTNN